MSNVNWFYVENKEKIGPKTQDEMEVLLNSFQISEDTFVWKKGLQNWQKLKDMSELMSLKKNLNLAEEPEELPELEMDLPPSRQFNWENIESDKRIFTIKQSEVGNIYGPFSLKMIVNLFKENRVDEKSLIFSPGMENWLFFYDIPIYQKLFQSLPSNLQVKDKRAVKRRPFIAKLYFHDNKNLFEGVCRDISIGGMQILISQFPGKKGDVLNFNVHPENSDYHFVANGRVDRILEGDQGIFVRFNQLDEHSINVINNYLDS